MFTATAELYDAIYSTFRTTPANRRTSPACCASQSSVLDRPRRGLRVRRARAAARPKASR